MKVLVDQKSIKSLHRRICLQRFTVHLLHVKAMNHLRLPIFLTKPTGRDGGLQRRGL